ncbi:MAG: hypothetical protein GWN99_02630 [Gemmatimonadetes bacterium]|uniref:Lipoprotein n=1 Tax=Candidatus Kutchimonas denitrificans TaxID=3056748 RepID=A0AAE5C8W2_9BACT|nr:hypothetical protein [Gemmatimonadota bacterium]NIR74851.1 hypothetical protein [Candidatus Kutchimonas denitrificans]NIR99962.1 hypothetical protein [Gemmatimonadota bacterium]NIT65546.1 hypothetical protein [Gemmatimonadota bacterium]NIU52516.1 hypothetical protein [Gemmatimonadota bacterium]
MRRNALRHLAVTALLGSYACGGPKAEQRLDESPVGTQVVVERSDTNRPDWTLRLPEDRDGYKYFSGGEEGYTDYALGFRMAKAEALQELGERVLGIWSWLVQTSEVGGKSEIQGYGRTYQELVVKEIDSGKEERYYEKVATKTAYGVEYRYNTFVLLHISGDEYRRAQIRALEELGKRARRQGNSSLREFIDESIARLNEIEKKG